jgi:hypothetical protein
MNETELKTLWDKLQGKLNVGTFESFKNKMTTQEQRKRFFDKYYQKLKDEFNFTLGNYDDFEKRLSTPQQSNANSGGGSSTPRTRGTILNPQDYEGINFKYKYPGDRNYIYGVKGNDWYAKNITNNRVFNISKDGFTSSVDKLKAQFPNAFKEVVQPINPETKTPETPTQDSTKVVTNVPPIKPVDSANTGTPVKPVDSANTGTNIPPQVKFVDSTTYKLEKI